MPCAINLLDPFADVERVIDAIKRAEDHYSVGAAKTTIDTLARAFGGGNENSSEDMGAVIRNADAIRNAIDHHVGLCPPLRQGRVQRQPRAFVAASRH